MEAIDVSSHKRFVSSLYWFFTAVVISYFKISGLKQHVHMVLRLKSAVLIDLWAKGRVVISSFLFKIATPQSPKPCLSLLPWWESLA